jgi:hypothetical protein
LPPEGWPAGYRGAYFWVKTMPSKPASTWATP